MSTRSCSVKREPGGPRHVQDVWPVKSHCAGLARAGTDTGCVPLRLAVAPGLFVSALNTWLRMAENSYVRAFYIAKKTPQ